MTVYELSPSGRSLIIYNARSPERKYNLTLTKAGVIIARGKLGESGTIYESVHTDLSMVPNEIRLDIMFTYIEAAITAVSEKTLDDISIGYDDSDALYLESIRDSKIGVSRFNEYTDVIRDYIKSRVATW